jgi:hypothetical protein
LLFGNVKSETASKEESSTVDEVKIIDKSVSVQGTDTPVKSTDQSKG